MSDRLLGLGDAMRAIAREDRFTERLEAGWLDGGCATYAEAALAYLAPLAPADEYLLDRDAKLHHRVARVGELLFDGDGATHRPEFLHFWVEVELVTPPVRLVPAAEVSERDRRYFLNRILDHELAADLADAWRDELGDPR